VTWVEVLVLWAVRLTGGAALISVCVWCTYAALDRTLKMLGIWRDCVFWIAALRRRRLRRARRWGRAR
jgi:hypothetical protein